MFITLDDAHMTAGVLLPKRGMRSYFRVYLALKIQGTVLFLFIVPEQYSICRQPQVGTHLQGSLSSYENEKFNSDVLHGRWYPDRHITAAG